MRKKKMIFTISMFTAGFIILSMMASLLYHEFKTWPEEKFIGSNITKLEQYLETKRVVLSNLNGPFSTNERLDFERISGKLLDNQKLFHFWSDREHWNFPIGTVTYGAYVLVEDDIIIRFKKNKSVDSL